MFQAPDTDTVPEAAGFKAPEDDADPKSLAGFGKNAWEDVKGTVKGLGDLAEGVVDHPVDTLKGIPGALVDEGKRLGVGELLTGHPINAVEKFGNAAYNKPLSTALDVAPVIGTAAKAIGLGGVAAEGAEAAATAARGAKALEGITPAAKAATAAESALPGAEAAADVSRGTNLADLPVLPKGAKTGPPHALFAYNDEFGPGGAPRSIYNVFGDPENPVVKQRGWGSSVPAEELEKAGIPITGRQPGSEQYTPIGKPSEPPPSTPPPPKTPPPASTDPLQEVKDWIAAKTQGVQQTPGWQEKAAKYVKNEVADLRAKDIGLRDPMIRSLDPKNPLKALEKAEELMGYAGQKGYFKPGLTDVARKDLIQSRTSEFGKNIGAVRSVGSQRTAPPIDEIRNAIKTGLTSEYGTKAAREIKTVLADFDRKVKQDPSFNGLANVATYLNGEKSTFNKIGQNAGPTTDAANIIGRMNNEALRKVLSPEENAFYTENLRDFGAHKKLEKMVASSGRRAMTGRGAPGGALASLWQQLWDRGGYRVAGNVADRVSGSVLKNPEKFKTLPDFFEELAHHADDVLDESLGTDTPGMSKGGVVPDDVKSWIASRGC